jgi:hypothetical protein
LFLADGINGVNFDGFSRDAFRLNSTEIEETLSFQNPLVVEELHTNGGMLFDVPMERFLGELEVGEDLKQYEENLADLEVQGRDLLASYEDRAFILDRFEFQQTLVGRNIQKAVPLKIQFPDGRVDQLLVVFEENFNVSSSSLDFWVWDPMTYKFVEHPGIKRLDYDAKLHRITNLERLEHLGREFLVLEIYLVQQKTYRQCLLDFDPIKLTFKSFQQFESPVSRRFISLSGSNSSCLASYSPDSPNIQAHCGSADKLFLETSPIKSISRLDQLMILLSDDRRVEIWLNQARQQVLLVPNSVCVASVSFKGKSYLAVCSYPMEGAGVQQGSIEIYESHSDQPFSLVQTIQHKIPRKLQFSILPTQELILYALQDNPTQPLIIFKYTGITYFKEVLTYSPLIANAVDFVPIQIYEETELLAVVQKPNQILVVEAVMLKY